VLLDVFKTAFFIAAIFNCLFCLYRIFSKTFFLSFELFLLNFFVF